MLCFRKRPSMGSRHLFNYFNWIYLVCWKFGLRGLKRNIAEKIVFFFHASSKPRMSGQFVAGLCFSLRWILYKGSWNIELTRPALLTVYHCLANSSRNSLHFIHIWSRTFSSWAGRSREALHIEYKKNDNKSRLWRFLSKLKSQRTWTPNHWLLFWPHRFFSQSSCLLVQQYFMALRKMKPVV